MAGYSHYVAIAGKDGQPPIWKQAAPSRPVAIQMALAQMPELAIADRKRFELTGRLAPKKGGYVQVVKCTHDEEGTNPHIWTCCSQGPGTFRLVDTRCCYE